MQHNNRCARNVHNLLILYHKSEMPYTPEQHGAVQGGEDISNPRPCVTVLHPGQLNGPPQFVAESKPFRPIRFHWSNPFHDRIDGENIRLELDVGMMSA